MKMINISRNADHYIIKTIDSVRMLGKDMFSRNKTYQKKFSDDTWYESNSDKAVSEQKKLKLDKWLKDHRKFIEHK